MPHSRASLITSLFMRALGVTHLAGYTACNGKHDAPPWSFEQAAQPIVGGVEAPEGAWPTVVSVFYTGAPTPPWHCGGTLIGPRWVLTAGHCVLEGSTDDYTVGIGRHAIQSSAGHIAGVSHLIPHPEFVYPDERFVGFKDVALIELDEDVPGPYSRLVSSARMAEIVADDDATVLGWGSTDAVWTPSPVLRMGVVEVVGRGAACEAATDNEDVLENEICLGDGDPDFCTTDSGGPAFVKRDGEWFVLGVVNWNSISCEQDAGVYAYVPDYINWVHETASGAPAPSWLPSAQIITVL